METIKISLLPKCLQTSELAITIDESSISVPKKYFLNKIPNIRSEKQFLQILNILRYWMVNELPQEIYDYLQNNDQPNLNDYKDFFHQELVEHKEKYKLFVKLDGLERTAKRHHYIYYSYMQRKKISLHKLKIFVEKLEKEKEIDDKKNILFELKKERFKGKKIPNIYSINDDLDYLQRVQRHYVFGEDTLTCSEKMCESTISSVELMFGYHDYGKFVNKSSMSKCIDKIYNEHVYKKKHASPELAFLMKILQSGVFYHLQKAKN